MRAAIDLAKTRSRTIWIDCDVLQADGGTRTAGDQWAHLFGACPLAVQRLMADGKLAEQTRCCTRSRGGERRGLWGHTARCLRFVLHGRRRRRGGHESGDEFGG